MKVLIHQDVTNNSLPSKSLLSLMLSLGMTKIMSTMVTGYMLLSLTACQSTPANTAYDVDRYVETESLSSSQETDANKVATVRTRMAAEYIRDNKLDAAQRELERAFAADKRYAPAYDMMGVLLQKEGSAVNLAKADAFFRKAIKIAPDFMQSHNNYGVYLSQMGHHEAAIQQFEIAGSALGYEGRVGALENLGRTALKVNNSELAINAFIRVLEVDRNNLIAHLELVDLLIANDRYNQAQNLYQELLGLMGSDAYRVPRILLQGIKLARLQNNVYQQEKLSRQLLSDFPLSEEAKKLKGWIRNPEATWK